MNNPPGVSTFSELKLQEIFEHNQSPKGEVALVVCQGWPSGHPKATLPKSGLTFSVPNAAGN